MTGLIAGARLIGLALTAVVLGLFAVSMDGSPPSPAVTVQASEVPTFETMIAQADTVPTASLEPAAPVTFKGSRPDFSVVPSDIPDLSPEDYGLQKPTLQILYFYADWCVHCPSMDPVLAKMAKEGAIVGKSQYSDLRLVDCTSRSSESMKYASRFIRPNEGELNLPLFLIVDQEGRELSRMQGMVHVGWDTRTGENFYKPITAGGLIAWWNRTKDSHRTGSGSAPKSSDRPFSSIGS